MALYLVSKIAGDKIAMMFQLAIEYDPKPPLIADRLIKYRKKCLINLINRQIEI